MAKYQFMNQPVVHFCKAPSFFNYINYPLFIVAERKLGFTWIFYI